MSIIKVLKTQSETIILYFFQVEHQNTTLFDIKIDKIEIVLLFLTF
jgi:hypothetical protein